MSVGELSRQVIENIVKAYRALVELLKCEIPDSILMKVLREVEHIAIHELVHGAIRTVYPEIDRLEEGDPVLGECIDEVAARLLEIYVSRAVGAYVHSFEEHAHELEHYAMLAELKIDAEKLRGLYAEAVVYIERGELRDVIELVRERCYEWLSYARSGHG